MGFYRYLMCVIDINALMILYACGLCVQVGVICLYIYYLSICKTMTLCVYVYVFITSMLNCMLTCKENLCAKCIV